jgi:hypothetical protein
MVLYYKVLLYNLRFKVRENMMISSVKLNNIKAITLKTLNKKLSVFKNFKKS